LLATYFCVVIVLGLLSLDWTRTTRGIFLLPYGFIFAGTGFVFVKSFFTNKPAAFIFSCFAVFAIFLLNVYKSQIGVFASKKSTGYTGMALIIKTLDQAKNTGEHVFFVISPSLNINNYLGDLPTMVQAYHLSGVSYTVIKPDAIYCPTKNSTFVYFQEDQAADQKIAQLSCNKNLTHLQILKPDTTIF
jgi:hypothetical protein